MVTSNSTLYTEQGYLNFGSVDSRGAVFNFLIGGRGTGKTYGCLQYTLETEKKFLFLRRNQTQIDIISRPEFNPFKPIDPDIEIEKLTKYHSAFTVEEKIIGYAAALSTISKIRGFDASDIEVIIFDEFIPEPHEHLVKNEGLALLNAYETINRNRELSGADPVRLFCLANSNNFDSDILSSFGLYPMIDKAIRTGREVIHDKRRSVLLVLLNDSKISERKKQTALYKATSSDEFLNMSIGNQFDTGGANVHSMNLTGLRLIGRVYDLGIYITDTGFYIRKSAETAPHNYDNKKALKKFRTEFRGLFIAEMNGRVTFENLWALSRWRQLTEL